MTEPLEALEKGVNWSSLAKKYLEGQKNRINSSSKQFNKSMSLNLLALIEEYYSLVIDFHKWLLTRQREIHSEEFNRLDTKKQELRELAIPDEVAAALTDIGRTKNPDEAFCRLLTPEQRRQLELIPLESLQHVEALLTMVKRQAPISQELESRVKRAYQKYLVDDAG